MNPWHDIDVKRIKPDDFVCVVEIPKGTRNKYEIDSESGMLMLDRVFTTSMVYPANYGYIPHTLCEDGDALDVLVLCEVEIPPMTLVRCVPIGMFEMIDNGERDEKIIAVPVYKNSLFGAYKDLKDLPSRYVDEILHFFGTYKSLEANNDVKIKPAQDKKAAMAIIKEAMALYKKKFN